MRRFKKLEIENLKEIFEWRNHPSVRLSMFKQNKIKWEEHLNWFEKRSNQEEIYDLLYLESNQNIGFMSFDCSFDNNSCEWGFYLNPFIKHGMGLNLGYDAIEYCFKNLSVEKIIGNVCNFSSIWLCITPFDIFKQCTHVIITIYVRYAAPQIVTF